MNMEDLFYRKAAALVLKKRLKIEMPTQNQISEMVEILSNVWLKRATLFDKQLTEQEKLCLLFSSHGNSTKDIAELLGVSAATIKTHKGQILSKLACKTMTQAAIKGIRYGFPIAENK